MTGIAGNRDVMLDAAFQFFIFWTYVVSRSGTCFRPPNFSEFVSNWWRGWLLLLFFGDQGTFHQFHRNNPRCREHLRTGEKIIDKSWQSAPFGSWKKWGREELDNSVVFRRLATSNWVSQNWTDLTYINNWNIQILMAKIYCTVISITVYISIKKYQSLFFIVEIYFLIWFSSAERYIWLILILFTISHSLLWSHE